MVGHTDITAASESKHMMMLAFSQASSIPKRSLPGVQPSATALMYENKEYEKKYLEKLKELDALHIIEPNARLGQKLVYLIQDFILNLTDWKMEVETNNNSGELYAKTWQQCRHFVLPMNPQRTELEYAIKYSLKKIGVKLKNPKKTQSKQTNPKTNKQVKK